MTAGHPQTRSRRRGLALGLAVLGLILAMGGGALAAAKLKANAVKTRNIRNDAVTTQKLALGAVTTDKLAPAAVTGERLADDAVSGGKVAPGSLSPSDITGLPRIVAKGTISEPGLLAGSDCSPPINKAVSGAEAGDEIVLTAPGNFTTLETLLTGTVTDGAIHYVACNLSGTNQNYGTTEDLKFLVLR